MGVQSHFVLFLVSVFIFNAAGLKQHDRNLATVHVISAMPRDSGSAQIHCSSRYTDYGMRELRVGDDYQFGVREKALYYCGAISARQIASWHAFQPRRDKNQTAVFWLVKKDGFFLSWDNSSWVRKSTWFYE